MTLAAATVFEVRTAGSDVNGGGFVTGSGGTDQSQANGPSISVSDAVTNGTTTVTSATANFPTNVVGNIVYINGNWYQIITRNSASSITVDATISAASGLTLNVGGALGSPGRASALMTVNGMISWVKSGNYSMTQAAAGSGGPVLFTASGQMEGYQTSRGDRTGTIPILSWASVASPGSQSFIYAVTGPFTTLRNMGADGNAVANVSGFSIDDDTESCLSQNCSASGQYGFFTSGNRCVFACGAHNCATGFYGANLWCDGCTGWGCGGYGFQVGQASDCNAYSNGYGFATQNFGANLCFLIRCTSDSNTHDGFTEQTTAAGGQYKNCASTNNGGYGFNLDFNLRASLSGCCAYNNTLGTFPAGVTLLTNENMITPTSSPWVGGGNYQPNNTANSGKLLRGVAIAVYGQTDNRDVGAVQHPDPAAGGPVGTNLNGGFVN
jgi:hypothetical protein